MKISKLSAMPNPAFYRRSDGTTWAKLNEGFHVPAKQRADGSIVGDGVAQKLNPNEDVEVIRG